MDVLDFFSSGMQDGGRYEDGASRSDNGRIRLCDPSGSSCPHPHPYGLFTDTGTTSGADGNMLDTLRLSVPTAVETVFFSTANVDALQEALRHAVYTASGQDKLVVGRQSDVELGIVMRATYFAEDRRGRAMSVTQHVVQLNKAVLAFCVPTVLNEARMYLAYRQSILRLPVPMVAPQIESQKGSRQTGLSRFF